MREKEVGRKEGRTDEKKEENFLSLLSNLPLPLVVSPVKDEEHYQGVIRRGDFSEGRSRRTEDESYWPTPISVRYGQKSHIIVVTKESERCTQQDNGHPP